MNPQSDNHSLEGILVADFSRVLAGPMATMILGDLGAEVVKVERPQTGDDTRSWGPPFASDGESTYYLSVNRNKRSVAINLKTEEGLKKARNLALRSDVLVENFKPGKMESFGLGYSQLSDANPRLIYARITGFGSGLGANLPGYDYLVQAMSGFMSITGDPNGPPMKTGVAIVDVLTALFTTSGVLAAIVERERSGKGQLVEVSLFGSALSGLVNQASSFLVSDVVPGRMGIFHPSIAPYEVFETVTEPMVVAVGNDGQFAKLCSVLGLEELVYDERWVNNESRVRNRHRLHDLLQEVLAKETTNFWVERLRKGNVPCGPINDIREAFRLATEFGLDPIALVPRSDGSKMPTTANPIGLSRTPVTYRRAPPRLDDDGPEQAL